MKTFLMYKNKDFDINQKLPSNEQDLTQDLELNILFDAMISSMPDAVSEIPFR